MVGQVQQSLYCIIDGQVTVSIVDPHGEEFGLTIWKPGNWFGESAFHEDNVMPLQAKAKTATSILEIPIKAIDEVLDNGTVFYRNIMLDIIGHSKLLYQLVEVLLFRPLRSRVAMRMLYLIETIGQADGDSVILPTKFSQSDFANMSGGSRQRVNQIFRDWADRGIINKQNKRYVVHNIHALKAELEATDE